MHKSYLVGIAVAFSALLLGSVPTLASVSGAKESHAKALRTITIEGGASASSANLYLGILTGLYRRYGLNVQLSIDSNTVANAALLNGSTDMGLVSSGVFGPEVGPNPPVQVILDTTLVDALAVGSPSITSLSQLRGKTIGVTTPGSTTAGAFVEALAAAGLPVGSYNVAYLTNNAGLTAALEGGSVQAVAVTPPSNFVLNQAGFPTIANIGAYSTASSFAINEKWGRAHRSLVTKFLTAVCAATKVAIDNKVYTAATLTAYAGLTSLSQLNGTWSLQRKVWTCAPYPSIEMKDVLTEDVVPPLTANPNPFIDDSYMDAVPRSDWITPKTWTAEWKLSHQNKGVRK